jgi:hypothetical protein
LETCLRIEPALVIALPSPLGAVAPGPSVVNSSSGPGALVALVATGTIAALVLWISWRKPTLVFLIALAALAIRPQLLSGGQAIGYEWGLHQTLYSSLFSSTPRATASAPRSLGRLRLWSSPSSSASHSAICIPS